tara:strand:- start:775 stop:1077 length:303 start_codon:yes stop_codon:yes gene_type:complete
MNTTLLGLSFDTSKFHKGIQLVLSYGMYELSVICHEGSYGGPEGLFEIMVTETINGEGVVLPGITNEGDTVRGWLTLEEVANICKKMTTITGNDPVKVAI